MTLAQDGGGLPKRRYDHGGGWRLSTESRYAQFHGPTRLNELRFSPSINPQVLMVGRDRRARRCHSAGPAVSTFAL